MSNNYNFMYLVLSSIFVLYYRHKSNIRARGNTVRYRRILFHFEIPSDSSVVCTYFFFTCHVLRFINHRFSQSRNVNNTILLLILFIRTCDWNSLIILVRTAKDVAVIVSLVISANIIQYSLFKDIHWT